MASELAVIDAANYLALQDGGQIAEAMAANLGEGVQLRESDLTRVSIPSAGGTKWTISSLIEDEVTDAIEGVLVYQTVRGLIWPNDEPQEGTLPAMVSHDLKIGRLVGDRDSIDAKLLQSFECAKIKGGDTYDWQELPQNQWGSAKKGAGKAATEQRVLYILRNKEPLPLVVCVQPGSLKNWRKFILALTKSKVCYWQAVVKLSLEKVKNAEGTSYAQIVPTLVGVLNKEQGAAVKETMSKPMAQVAASAFLS